MPVFKIKKNGVWEEISGISEHTHTKKDITDFPISLPADGGNADTLGGKSADEFAIAADIEELRELIENISVEVDTTLSQEGKAADAKAVGEAIKEAEENALNNGVAILAEAQKSVDALAASIQYLTATDDGNGIITLDFTPLAPASEVTF